MSVKYCLPIIRSVVSDVSALIESEKERYDLFEVWLDYLEDLDPEAITELAKALGTRGIFLFRRQNLEPIRMSPEKREAAANAIAGTGALLDVDVLSQPEDAELAEAVGIPLIASYHNYDFTPSSSELRGIADRLLETNPEILKVAVMCRSRRDALRVLEFKLKIEEQKIRHIVLGMGPHGVITRVFGTIWGNEMAFAPRSSEEKSAPGQLERNELEQVLKLLNGS